MAKALPLSKQESLHCSLNRTKRMRWVSGAANATATRFTSDQRAELIHRLITRCSASPAGDRALRPGRLRILMYTAYFDPEYSGAALQALTLAVELRRRGHRVEFITTRWPGLADTATVDGFAVTRLEPGRLRKHSAGWWGAGC